jgi:hypothetical protein
VVAIQADVDDGDLVSIGSSAESFEQVFDDGEFEEVIAEHLESIGLLVPEPRKPGCIAQVVKDANAGPVLKPSDQWALTKLKKGGEPKAKGGSRKRLWASGDRKVRERPAAMAKAVEEDADGDGDDEEGEEEEEQEEPDDECPAGETPEGEKPCATGD